jgi:DNA-binding response OmpR family regulator
MNAAARILYVEDDEDVRETMTMLLEHEGYRVSAVPTAEAALDQLSKFRFDLLLTDFQLPQENAAWLIREASAAGTLGETPVIILSAAADPHEVAGYRFLRKPIGQEALLAAFEAAMPKHARVPHTVTLETELRLVLYISAKSQASRMARRNLSQALQGVDERRVHLTVHDVDGPDRGWEDGVEEDRIVVLPTLVRQSPQPRVWIAGDLSDIELVRDTLIPASSRYT